MDIPPEKTKAYWEKKMPDMYMISRIFTVKHLCIKYFLIGVFLTFFILILESIYSEINLVWILGLTWAIFTISCEMAYSYYSIFFIKRNDGIDPIISKICIIYEKEQFVGPIFGGIAKESPVNKLFPDDMVVSEIILNYKTSGQKYCYFPRRRLFCLCTEEKQEEIEKLIHMKERLTLRKESRRFKVTYKKYSKELVRIDLCEDEEYPAHCHYEELIERINIMF